MHHVIEPDLLIKSTLGDGDTLIDVRSEIIAPLAAVVQMTEGQKAYTYGENKYRKKVNDQAFAFISSYIYIYIYRALCSIAYLLYYVSLHISPLSNELYHDSAYYGNKNISLIVALAIEASICYNQSLKYEGLCPFLKKDFSYG